MKKLHIGAILLGGLVVAPFQASMAQTNVAYAHANEQPSYVVFFDKGTSQLSAIADETPVNMVEANKTVKRTGRAWARSNVDTPPMIDSRISRQPR